MTGRPAARSAFVTGATGFVGRHLVEELCRLGWEVTAFCLPTDHREVLPPVARVAVGDITDVDSLRAGLPARSDVVFHLAANTSTWPRRASRQYRDNVTGTANVAAVAIEKSAGRLVYTSSISAFGYQPGRLIDETTTSTVHLRGDQYGRTKFAAEQHLKRLAVERGLPVVILNPVNVLGPYDRANWTRQLILPVSRGTLRAVPPGSGSWAYVIDVVAAHLAAARDGRSGENYLLGGVEASFRRVVDEIAAILGRPPSRRATPAAVLRLALWAATARSALDHRQPALTLPQYRRAVGDLRCDDTKARRELGYRHTDLHTMLADTIDWLRREGLLTAPDATEGLR